MCKKINFVIILDYFGCIVKYGLLCEICEWLLDGEQKGNCKKKDDELDVNVFQCGKCYVVFKFGVDVCFMCGVEVECKDCKLNEVEGEFE